MREVEKITYIHTWISIAFIVIAVIILSACNRQVIDLEYNYNAAIIEGVGKVSVRSWCDYDNSDMIQVIDADGKVYLTHSSNVILIKE